MNIREKTINTKFLSLFGSEKCAGRDTSDTTPPPPVTDGDWLWLFAPSTRKKKTPKEEEEKDTEVGDAQESIAS